MIFANRSEWPIIHGVVLYLANFRNPNIKDYTPNKKKKIYILLSVANGSSKVIHLRLNAGMTRCTVV